MKRIYELRNNWHEINDAVFGGGLTPITLLCKRNQTRDGWYEYRAHADWTPIRHELWRASIVVCDGCWPEGTVLGTLAHEMIHQYQCEVLNVAPHHDEQFQRLASALEKRYGVTIR